MERARLRALTQLIIYFVPYKDCRSVEMERARLRALTLFILHLFVLSASFGRNGESPIKGIDTPSHRPTTRHSDRVEMERARLRALTQTSSALQTTQLSSVEMERARLRALTQCIYSDLLHLPGRG